jgi:predicted DsbA family dithiol-disulfide isomerase
MSEPIELEVFSDYVCPWCYLGDNRVKRLKQEFNITVKLVHFPLHPETPSDGKSLADLFGRGPDELKVGHDQMQGLMDAEGLPYNQRSHTYNSRLAQEIGSWAETQPGGDVIHDKFYEAYFVDRCNVGDVEVIIDVVKSAGLDEAEARKVIAERSFKEAVDNDWAKSRGYGVTGVPTFVSSGQGLVGAQPYEVLEQLMTAVGAERRVD